MMFEDSSGKATSEATVESGEAIAEKLFGKDDGEEQAGEGEQTEAKTWLDEGVEQAAKEGVQERYELRLPEGTIVNAEMRGEFETLAKENRLGNEAAQRLVDMHLKSVGQAVREWTDMGEKRYAEVKGWGVEFNNDPYFGGANKARTVADARKVLNAFGTPSEVARLKAELNKTGLGEHPVLIKGLTRIARLLGDRLASSNEGKTLEEIFYPKK